MSLGYQSDSARSTTAGAYRFDDRARARVAWIWRVTEFGLNHDDFLSVAGDRGTGLRDVT